MLIELAVIASFYHSRFDGRITASGEVYNHAAFTCAHKSLPFGSRAEFTRGNRSIILRVNDRGPFVPGRDYDVSGAAAKWLRMTGVHKIKVRLLSNSNSKKLRKIDPKISSRPLILSEITPILKGGDLDGCSPGTRGYHSSQSQRPWGRENGYSDSSAAGAYAPARRPDVPLEWGFRFCPWSGDARAILGPVPIPGLVATLKACVLPVLDVVWGTGA